MNEIKFSTSTCRYCRFYQPEGRRGGSCQMLGVPVQSSWKVCALAASPFKATLKKLEDIFQLETVTSADCATSSTETSRMQGELDSRPVAVPELK